MRKGNFYFKISFRLRFIEREWQDRLWFFERQAPVKSVFLFLNEELFWILICKIAIALCLCLSDWVSFIVLEAFATNSSELFHSGKMILKMNLNNNERSWFGFQLSYQLFFPSNFVSRGSSDNENSVAPTLMIMLFKNTASHLNA